MGSHPLLNLFQPASWTLSLNYWFYRAILQYAKLSRILIKIKQLNCVTSYIFILYLRIIR